MALGRRYKLLDNVTIVFPVHVLNNLLFETTVRLVPVLSAFLITNFFTVKQIMDPFFDVQWWKTMVWLLVTLCFLRQWLLVKGRKRRRSKSSAWVHRWLKEKMFLACATSSPPSMTPLSMSLICRASKSSSHTAINMPSLGSECRAKRLLSIDAACWWKQWCWASHVHCAYLKRKKWVSYLFNLNLKFPPDFSRVPYVYHWAWISSNVFVVSGRPSAVWLEGWRWRQTEMSHLHMLPCWLLRMLLSAAKSLESQRCISNWEPPEATGNKHTHMACLFWHLMSIWLSVCLSDWLV